MDFESILQEILLGRGQGNLKLEPKQKEALQAIVFERSRLFNCWSNYERLGLINKRVLFSSHDLVQSVISQTVN